MAPTGDSTPPSGVPSAQPRGVPTAAEADALATQLLADEDTRLSHVRTAGFLASRLAGLFGADDTALLVAAASLHDIGYSAQVVRTGFHPLDGGLYLQAAGYPERLTALIAHHSLACLMAPAPVLEELSRDFPRERSLLVDALVYSDMHSAPDGRIIRGETRLADIAARRPTEYQARRAAGLRAAMGRVGAAILAASPTVPVPAPERPPAHAEAEPESDLAAWWIEEARRCVAAADAPGPDAVESGPR